MEKMKKFSAYLLVRNLKKAFGCVIIHASRKRKEKVMKFLTDMHTHSTYSHDGQNDLKDMLAKAQELGVGFYGVSEHFNFDYDLSKFTADIVALLSRERPEEYFHGARHLQEDYEGVMNVLVGAEFGYSDDKAVMERYQEVVKRYAPDYIINSVHGADGGDYAYELVAQDKKTTYGGYLALIRRSLDAPYPYDIVGHIGYIARYVPFEDVRFDRETFGEQIDDILQTIIAKDKILEINSSSKQLAQRSIPDYSIVRRYFELGGRKISFGSDTHGLNRIMEKREEIVSVLKEIGFTYITVPCRGEHIKVEI